MKKITKIKSIGYNFHQTGDNEMGMSSDWDFAEIGKSQFRTKEVPKSIVETEPNNGLQQHYVDIYYESGVRKRIFNMCEITYYSESELEELGSLLNVKFKNRDNENNN